MRIKMLASFAGIDFSVSAGDVTDRFSDAECIRMIERGFAIPMAAPIERAVKAACETRDPLDHDGDGKKGGSLKGAQSTRAKGKRK